MRLLSGESGVASKPSFHVARQVPSWGDSWEKETGTLLPCSVGLSVHRSGLRSETSQMSDSRERMDGWSMSRGGHSRAEAPRWAGPVLTVCRCAQ